MYNTAGGDPHRVRRPRNARKYGRRDLNPGSGRNTWEEDEEVVAGIHQREPRAMELLYERLSRQAFGLAYRILGDGPSAEDAVQEAFLTVWRHGERIDLARGKLASFVMTIVHHKAIDMLRSRRRQTAFALDPVDLEKQGPDIADRAAQSMSREAISKALQSLPDEQRRPILMAYFEGLTHVEIADALKLPLGTVKSRLRLGLQKMRASLQEVRN